MFLFIIFLDHTVILHSLSLFSSEWIIFSLLSSNLEKRTKEPLDESESGEWTSWLKTQHSENEDHAPGPITSWEIDGETVETVTDFILGAPKSLQMVTAAMKLKDT